jgi:poly-gamma-glutamate synthesis protein (capsule biosynthesis protein)
VFDTEGRVNLSEEEARARVLFVGDLCPINRVQTMLLAGDVAGAFGDTRELFRQSDLTVVNLEAPLCALEAPIAKLGPNFRADPEVARALAAVPVHAACLANNHVTDQGDAGLAETLAALDDAGIGHVGAGPDQNRAGGPLRLEASGVRLALLDFAVVEGAIPREGPGAARIDHLVVRRAVAEAAADGAVVIPSLHAGKEGVLFPSPGLQALCRELVEAGAAAVICHHPHVPQGIELYRGRPIAYSLGNFLFDWPEPEMETDSSFLLELGLGAAGVAEFSIHPFRKSAGGGAELLRGEARADYLKFIAELSAPLTQEERLSALWREQCRALLDSWYKPRLARGALLDSDDPAERRRAGLTFLNLMENDEHGAVLKQALLDEVTGRAAPDEDARRELDALVDRLKSFTLEKS